MKGRFKNNLKKKQQQSPQHKIRKIWSIPVGKIPEKEVCRSVFFDNIALYFKCRIKKKRTPSDCFFRHFCPLGSSSIEHLTDIFKNKQTFTVFNCKTKMYLAGGYIVDFFNFYKHLIWVIFDYFSFFFFLLGAWPTEERTRTTEYGEKTEHLFDLSRTEESGIEYNL